MSAVNLSVANLSGVCTFLLCFAVTYLWHTLGTTIGYHRLLSHRSFKCPKAVEYFFVLGGYLCLESSPICWVVVHRHHHRNADVHEDPHSPLSGLWNAYIGWMLKFHYDEELNARKIAPDLFKDSLYRFLEQGGNLYRGYALCVFICILFRVLVYLVFGPIAATASVCAGLAAQQAPLLLNVVSHMPKFGYRSFDLPDHSTNVWWVALLTMGEGWHNNHHRFPNSAKNGLAKNELDVSWCVLKGLKKLKLISDVIEPSTA